MRRRTELYTLLLCVLLLAFVITARVFASAPAPEVTPQPAPEADRLQLEEIDGEWYVTAGHPMTKEHYISVAAYINDSTVMLFKQYPEWNMQFRMPLCRSGRLVWYCTKCGLLYQDIRRK